MYVERLYIVHCTCKCCTMYSIHYTLYVERLYSIHCTVYMLYIVHCTWKGCTLYTIRVKVVQYTLYTVRGKVIQYTLYSVHVLHCTLHIVRVKVVHCTSCTVYRCTMYRLYHPSNTHVYNTERCIQCTHYTIEQDWYIVYTGI